MCVLHVQLDDEDPLVTDRPAIIEVDHVFLKSATAQDEPMQKTSSLKTNILHRA